MLENEFPSLYRSANELSIRSQSKFFSALLIHLLALVIAAILSVVNIPHWSVAMLQIISLLTALGCSIFLFIVRPERLWYGARAVAESIKTVSWRYICKAEPFHEDNIAKKVFNQKLRSIIDQNKDVCKVLTEYLNEAQVTEKMQSIRSKTLMDRKDIYLNYRIEDQHSWYATKSKFNKMKARHLILLLILINIFAVFCAFLRLIYIDVVFWPTDIFVAIAAGLLSWIQAKRFSELAASYSLASFEISIIKGEADQPTNEKDFSKFVSDTENAFSREHTQWIARKDV